MEPNLPSNPMTITPPTKMIPTAEGVWDMFKGRTLDEKFFADVRAELKNLRDWDNYFRTTDQGRESAKLVLRSFLNYER